MAPITKLLSLLGSASLINAIVVPESIADFPIAIDPILGSYDENAPLPSIFNLSLSDKTHKATVATASTSEDDNDDTPLPLVIWHGLGDNYKADGLAQVGELAAAVHPGTFVYNIHLDEDASADRTATFFGNLTLQIEQVCTLLSTHPILSTAPAIDAIGFSQGGQFLRGYISRCNNPPVRSLLTFGSQHNGISSFQSCSPTDFLCRGAQSLLRSNTWSAFVQSRLVPAQYFRDPVDLGPYLEHSNFLADINNERLLKNPTYKANMQKLERFVMYVFEDDETVIPKESAWWSEVNGTEVLPLRERAIYKEDWLGLKSLDERGALRFEKAPGVHMALSEELLEKAFKENFGVFGRKFDDKEEKGGNGHEEEL
ncbi:palmitoyl thioesterase protein [Rutstroemia sp. NJR-2017a BBW]|nr:palmitoyl thioesterase protein [Rutstroemia sp. NJR-2017a BBW]